ncbi:component of scar regulatory complex [Dictyostelium purpureum]|uniref:Component of scar regulatory complex n=1 Tax=Dictyostelium purpureum TaxID=5786 RepID=F0ZPQ3_DICPU|nr:component of scar regulatory complex [Dictyostelium purpureum]EGC34074.1 component of scar regulatory complex [Dictyostelium purpureum]|eukprot:XP_003289404.1 component of scar regulatory complex [Dictyostelium purpureum]
MSHNKIPEKFQLLLENGENILTRVYNTRLLFQNNKVKPSFIIDEKISKILKNLIAKYPELPENNDKSIQGFDLLTSRAKQHLEELEDHYYTLTDAFDWKEAAFLLLQDIATNTVAINFTNNIQLCSKFLDLLVLYGKVNYMVSLVTDRKIITAVYAKLFLYTRSASEPTYSRMSKWINEFENPIKKIQEEFRAINDSIGQALFSFESTYAKRRVITQLRKDGALNLILKPEDIARPVQDQYRIELAYAGHIYQWILYGYLFAPGCLTTQNSIDLAKFVLSEGFYLPVYKEVSISIHNEFNTLFKNYKSKTINLQKQKKIVKEAAQASTQEAPRKHAERRVYIRQELEAMWNLFRDKPCLLAPKINVLLAALSMAKEEIFWYFRHTDVTPPEKVKKFYNKQNEVRERRIASLLSLISHLVQLVQTHKKMIQNYYVEYIAGADILGLSKVITPQLLNTAGSVVTQQINTILNELKSITPGQEYRFDNFRANWMRLGYLLQSNSCPLKESEAKQITSRLNLIYTHSKNVDCLDQLLDEYGNLTGLWSFKDQLLNGVFDQAIVDMSADQPTHSMIFLKLLSQFPNNATQFYPEEKELIGKECVNFANSYLSKITNRIVSILGNSVAQTFLSNQHQLDDVNAAFPLLQKKKDWKPPKDFVPPIEPSSESQFRHRANLENLRNEEKNAYQLCNALNEFLEIVIYDHVFIPREFLREKLGNTLKQYMRQSIQPPQPTSSQMDVNIPRLGQYESNLRVFIGVLVFVENYVDIDIGDLIRQTILTEFYAKALGKSGRVDWFPEGEIEMNDLTLSTITNYYVDLVSKKLNVPGVVYSPVKLGFISKAGTPFRAEEHADLSEMRALCDLVGPYGLKVVEREILRFVQTTTASMKEILTLNSANLEEYAANYFKPKAIEILKRFKVTDFDAIVQKCIAIGNALHLRSMMREAMKDVISENLPYIHDSVSNAFKEYNCNTFMFPEFLGVDTLALDTGLDVGIADQYLKVILRKLSTESDKRVWELLPIMFSLTFFGNIWKEAQYKATIDAHSNNVHVLSKAICDLLIAFGAINSTSGNEAEITSSLSRFLEISSVNILRMFRGKPNEKFVPNEIQSVIVFLDKFTQQCPLLTKDSLEQFIPYSLIRNMYKDLFEHKVQKQQVETSEQNF